MLELFCQLLKCKLTVSYVGSWAGGSWWRTDAPGSSSAWFSYQRPISASASTDQSTPVGPPSPPTSPFLLSDWADWPKKTGGVSSMFIQNDAFPIYAKVVLLYTCIMSSKQLKMYFLASLDLTPISDSCSDGVWWNRKISLLAMKIKQHFISMNYSSRKRTFNLHSG